MKEQDTTYKFIPVKGKTHKQYKTLCAKEGKTFDEMLQDLIALKNVQGQHNQEARNGRNSREGKRKAGTVQRGVRRDRARGRAKKA